MLKIAKSIVVIAAVAALAVGATSAYFSDQESIPGNTFATGTLNLTLNHSRGKPFSVVGAYPGYWTNWEHMDIFNGPYSPTPPPSQLPFEAYMTINQTSGDSELWDVLKIKLKTSGWNSNCNDNDPGEGTIYDGYIKNFPSHKLVSKLTYWHLANEDDGSGTPPDNIRAGWSERVCQKVGLSTSVGNDVQGKSVTFDEVVDAEQDND